MKLCPALALALLLLLSVRVSGAAPALDTTRGDRMLAEYFRAETRAIASRSLAEVKTLADWTSRRDESRRQLLEMLGLWPQPVRTPLQAKVTGTVDHPEFTVEKVQFQSRPGLYVTGNLYLPKNRKGPAPTILYVCGHGNVKKDGVSYGSKVHYQHHPAWFARNGYVCLILDTLQLGEIEGLHHGTFRETMWWWHSRGYTPAGVEAWNCIRALDYLETRPEVDKSRFGVTGRSGGGAYSWWAAALDERIQAAAPVAGVTDLENHVVDGVVEGHCDCMYQVNTYRWDYGQLAAMVAPRPLLITNTDKDTIFPLEGVGRVHAQARRIYQLYGAADKLGLLITEGPHKDTQDLQVPVFRWFNRFLKGDTGQVEKTAVPFFPPEALRVFEQNPTDQQNTRIQENFVPAAGPPPVAQSADEWKRLRDGWLTGLREKSFGGWPAAAPDLNLKKVFSARKNGMRLRAFDFTSQEHVRLRLYVLEPEDQDKPPRAGLRVLGEQEWSRWLAVMRAEFPDELKGETSVLEAPQEPGTLAAPVGNTRTVILAPRGIGPTAWAQDEREAAHIRRRFALLGQTVDGMRVWDVRRAIQTLRAVEGLRTTPLSLHGSDEMAGVALYASLFEPNITSLALTNLSVSHREGPIFLNVLKILDVPQAVAMAAERSQVSLSQDASRGRREWDYVASTRERLGWDPAQFQVVPLPGFGGR